MQLHYVGKRSDIVVWSGGGEAKEVIVVELTDEN